MHTQKNTLRAEMKKQLPPADKPARDHVLLQHVLAVLPPHKCVAAFYPRLDEPDIFSALQQAGVDVALPVLSPDMAERLMGFARAGAGAVFKPNRFGILEPQGPWIKPDVVLVPGLAFGRDGTRLGRGKGFYDASLAALRQQNPTLQVFGVCYNFQVFETVPTDPHDIKMDRVLQA